MFKIYQPVKPFILNQRFGENRACVNDALKVIECNGSLPPAGYRSLYGPEGHKGIDLRTYHGQEVYCARDGEVVSIDTNPKTGLDVRVKSYDLGNVYLHIYEHLMGYSPKIGDKIKTGQLIGWADNTGYSSGDHLHFEMKENGVSVDPLKYMQNVYAKDIYYISDKIGWLKEQVALLADNLGDLLRRQ